MGYDILVQLCFINKVDDTFQGRVEHELFQLFSDKFTWLVEGKEEEGLHIITVDGRGIGEWANEEQYIAYMEQKMDNGIFNCIYGYRLSFYAQKNKCCGRYA
ncbi:hypothetical protein [Longirhabdus pacifica]|uniref:hypothetical protein n=1 Tax=Longirhabdus pacifica TaxID=2305227 RepID=UPI001008DF40|nr:hypothetical protein [Longirhabdus pacifica]